MTSVNDHALCPRDILSILRPMMVNGKYKTIEGGERHVVLFVVDSRRAATPQYSPTDASALPDFAIAPSIRSLSNIMIFHPCPLTPIISCLSSWIYSQKDFSCTTSSTYTHLYLPVSFSLCATFRPNTPASKNTLFFPPIRIFATFRAFSNSLRSTYALLFLMASPISSAERASPCARTTVACFS